MGDKKEEKELVIEGFVMQKAPAKDPDKSASSGTYGARRNHLAAGDCQVENCEGRSAAAGLELRVRTLLIKESSLQAGGSNGANIKETLKDIGEKLAMEHEAA